MTIKGILTTIPFAFVAVAGCGGRVEGGDGGTDGGEDSLKSDAANPDGQSGWTDCSSPSGYQICGGPANCSTCTFCTAKSPIGICGNGPNPFTGTQGCPLCPDGSVCVMGLVPDGGNDGVIYGSCVQWEVGDLYRREGFASDVIYADSSRFDGTPLPTPSDCPTISGITLCGGACGDTCPKDSTHACVGRSPKHPYSLCVDIAPITTSGSIVPGCTRTNPPANDGKHACLIFLDDTASQSLADVDGIAIDLATCQAAASAYPGGAECVVGK